MRTLRKAAEVPSHAAELLRECKRLIQQYAPNATVLLYGSVARGVAGPDSDWDLLVLTVAPPTPAQRRGISDALYGLELQHGLVISELVCSRDEWDASVSRVGPLHQNVDRDGVLI